jgi:hypothetical protein
MPAGFRVYSSSQVTISIAGVPITGGFADGEFLRIERETEAFSDVVGTDGEVTRNATKDDRATATILLMQSAESNATLSALHNNDKNTEGGAGVGRFLVEDLNGTTIHEGAQCWVMAEPDDSYDREATAREWQVRVANLISTRGGYA